MTYFLYTIFLFTNDLKWLEIRQVNMLKVRRAHKMHHKNIHKEDGECFGMLWVPMKYFKK